jgi:hypothetical protein
LKGKTVQNCVEKCKNCSKLRRKRQKLFKIASKKAKIVQNCVQKGKNVEEPERVAPVAEDDPSDDGKQGGKRAKQSGLFHPVVEDKAEVAGNVHGQEDEGEDVAPGVQPDHQNEFVGEDGLINEFSKLNNEISKRTN